jgi:L-asparaginase
MANLPRIALILTGGTIDSLGKDRLDLAWYIEAGKRLGDGELLKQLPELKEIAEVQEMPFRRLPSHALVDKDWLDLVRTIHNIFDEDKADGVVITHGLFSQPHVENRQARGGRRLDAAGVGHQRGWLFKRR